MQTHLSTIKEDPMKLTPLLATACLLALAPPVHAQVQFAWNDCLADGGATNRTSACAVETGTNRLVASYTTTGPLTNFVAIDGTIDLVSEAASIPEWWHFKNAGTCRLNAAGISIDVTVLPGEGASCTDVWDGGNGAIGLFTGYAVGYQGDPNLARAVFAIARPANQPTNLVAGTTYFGWTWTISNSGTAACAGCTTPVAIALKTVVLSQLDGFTQTLRSTDAGSEPCATWQSAAAPTCQVVPTVPRTWGSVKALYR
jgi:hypothetical protein